MLAASSLILASTWHATWRWDDTQILLFALQHRPIDYFFLPDVWRTLTAANLTPWLSLSYDLDLALFGLEPRLFYWHQLGALLLTALALRLCLGLWVSRHWAWLGALLFLVGAPATSITQQLANRHYIEGALFCLLSLYCHVRYLRQGQPRLLIAGALLYVLAVTAKEIYVPLVLLLPFLPEGRWRQRCIAAAPYVAIAALYTLWRGYMLGSFGGGYATADSLLSLAFILDVVITFLTFPLLLTGNWWPLATLLYLGLLTLYLMKERQVPFLCLLIGFLVLAPLTPLVQTPGILVADRYLFLPWIALCFSIGFFSGKLQLWQRAGTMPSLRSPAIPLAMFCLISASQGWQVMSQFAETGSEFDVQAAFIMDNDDSVAFVPSPVLTSSFWYYRGLKELKARYLDQGSAPVAVIDAIYLDPDLASLYTYDPGCGCLRDDSASLTARLERHQANNRPDAGLTLELSYLDGVFSWDAGPYTAGQWHFISDQMGGIAPAPPRGQMRVYVADGSELFLRYTSPEGWTTYTDPLTVREQVEPIRWSR